MALLEGEFLVSINSIIDISRAKERVFEFSEVSQLFPIIYSITRKASEQVQVLVDQLEMIDSKDDSKALILEEKINKIVDSWHDKIEKLGLRPQGLWVVDIDAGNGYYCWKYPEKKINHWHGYSDGFSNRVCLDEKQRPRELTL